MGTNPEIQAITTPVLQNEQHRNVRLYNTKQPYTGTPADSISSFRTCSEQEPAPVLTVEVVD